MIEIIENVSRGIDIISMRNENIEIQVTNYGCTILKMIVKDKHGEKRDVVLGFPSIDDYKKKDGSYLGALVGRVANRIGNGKFTLNNEIFSLEKNNGSNTLHGGIEGFSYKTFTYEIREKEIVFHYFSQDGEEGFPGNLNFYATYILLDNGLKIKYHATTDKDTIINITNHSYFNLSGEPCNIDEHELMIKADQMACIDDEGLFNGEIRSVCGTPFDFNTSTLIKNNIYQENDQLKIGKGYDHPFIFSTNKDQVKLYYEKTGIELTVSTSLPQAQVYTANYLSGQLGKYGKCMHQRDAICIETQNMPDSINKEKNPTVILRKGEMYDEVTSYTFKIK